MATVQIIGGGTQMNIFFCLGCLLILIGILTVETFSSSGKQRMSKGTNLV